MRLSHQRHPSSESPFSHARVSSLLRERDAVENQRFEMGPLRRPPSPGLKDYKKGHALGQATQGVGGVPLGTIEERDVEAVGPRARCNTLQNEYRAADQVLEWVPELSRCAKNASDGEGHGRLNVFNRERASSEDTREWALGVRPQENREGRGRRNVLLREEQTETFNLPQQACNLGPAVPSYGRKEMLPRTHGLLPPIAVH